MHASSPSPTSVHIANGIGDEGGKAIGKALEVNAMLTSLDLHCMCCGRRDRDGLRGGLRVWFVLGLKGMW